MPTQQNYQATVADYTAQLRGLFSVPEGVAAATRGAVDLPAELLAERAEKLAETSQQLGEMTANYLDSENLHEREAAEIKLLAQATAEVEVARALLETAEGGAEGTRSPAATRSSRAASIQQSIDELINVLETPLEAGIEPLLPAATRSATSRPLDPEEAKSGLQQEAESTLRYISKQTGKVGGRAVRDLLLMDAAILVEGVSLVSKDVGKLIDKLVAGVSEIAKKLATSALRLLLQAYDWVLELLGKDNEQSARKQVKEWLDELKEGDGEESEGLFDKLVKRIYTPDAIKVEIAGWLKTTQADVSGVNQAADTVEKLADKYRAKTEKVEYLLKGIALAKKIPIVNSPQGQLIIAAITLSILGYIIYTGYDHVDSGRIVFFQKFGIDIPDRVEGVRETVQKAMGVA